MSEDLSNLLGAKVKLDNHLPGYAGYIPSVNAENLFAKTYGDITRITKGNSNQNLQFITKTTGEEHIDERTKKYAFIYEKEVRDANRSR